MKKQLGVLIFALIVAVGLTGPVASQPVSASGCAPCFDPCSPFICPSACVGLLTYPVPTTAHVAKKSIKKKHVYKHHKVYKHYKHKIYKHTKMKAKAKCAAPVCPIPVCVVPIYGNI